MIRDHNNKMRHLPEEGKRVVLDAVWRKRLKDGDVVLVDESKPVVEKAVAAKSGDDKPAEQDKPAKAKTEKGAK